MVHLSRFVRWTQRFGAAEAGVAAVEFALLLPIMLLIYVGMVEASALIAVDRKVQSVSGAVGDLVARSDGTVPAATVNDYVRAAGGIMTPYSAAPLEQIVTQVWVPATGTPTVDWSRRYVNQALQGSGAHAQGSDYSLPEEITDISREQYVIVAESSYAYRPLYGIVFDQAINLYRENFYLPRFGERIVVSP